MGGAGECNIRAGVAEKDRTRSSDNYDVFNTEISA